MRQEVSLDWPNHGGTLEVFEGHLPCPPVMYDRAKRDQQDNLWCN